MRYAPEGSGGKQPCGKQRALRRRVLPVIRAPPACSPISPSPPPPAGLPTALLPQTEPEALRADLEALLAANGVAYSYSKTSKFANFIKKTLD
jgi:hypothetical protein